MANSGFHHVGLATHNMEATLNFYENILGFKTRVCEVIEPHTGGSIRHAFLDAGDGEMIAFMEFNEVPSVETNFDTGINRGLGLGAGVMHFAFKADDAADLEIKKNLLLSHGVATRGVIDHGWCQSIYFTDPNGLQLEYCVVTEDLDDTHIAEKQSEAWMKYARPDS